MANRIVHFILHVPRCAGTTVERHFEGHLGDGFRYAPRWENPLRHFVGNRYRGLTRVELARVQVVSGHSLSTRLRNLFPDAEIHESVLLRDPLTKLVSLYNLRHTRFREGRGPEPPDFETWYRRQRRNPISRFLLNRYFEQGIPALYRLSSRGRMAFLDGRFRDFHFVGAYQLVDELLANVSAELGIPGAATRHGETTAPKVRASDLPEATRSRILAENALDQALFERWSHRKWNRNHRPAPRRMPRADQLVYVVSDAVTGIRKTIAI